MGYGYEEGEVCGRNGCQGVIALPPLENCTCLINPPCPACTNNYFTCPVCGWVFDEYEKGEEMQASDKTEKKFNIGDLVVRRTDMIDVATGGGRSTFEGITRKVHEITETKEGFEYRTVSNNSNSGIGFKDDKEQHLMRAELATAAALAWLADRLAKVAAMAVRG